MPVEYQLDYLASHLVDSLFNLKKATRATKAI